MFESNQEFENMIYEEYTHRFPQLLSILWMLPSPPIHDDVAYDPDDRVAVEN